LLPFDWTSRTGNESPCLTKGRALRCSPLETPLDKVHPVASHGEWESFKRLMKLKLLFQNILLSLGLGTVLLVSYFLIPDPRGYGTHEHLFLPPCFIRFFFHIPCPACGLTTAFAYLAKGHFQEAFQTHWMSPFLFTLLCFLFFYSIVCVFSKKLFWNIFENKWTPYISSFLLLGMLLCWALKLFTNGEYLFAVRSFF